MIHKYLRHWHRLVHIASMAGPESYIESFDTRLAIRKLERRRLLTVGATFLGGALDITIDNSGDTTAQLRVDPGDATQFQVVDGALTTILTDSIASLTSVTVLGDGDGVGGVVDPPIGDFSISGDFSAATIASVDVNNVDSVQLLSDVSMATTIDFDLDASGTIEFGGTLAVGGDADIVGGAAITDAASTSLTVTGEATINAGASTITLGDDVGDSTNFGSLNVAGGTVTITEDSGTELSGVSATTFSLTSTGDITDANGASISVTGLATLNAGASSITLGDDVGDTTNFGSLNLTAASATVTEDSATELTGVAATTISITSGGDITDATGTTMGVTDLATFDAGVNAITLGGDVGDTTNFGSVSLTGGAVTLTENSETHLAGVNATTLDLTSVGQVTQTDDIVDVSGNAAFTLSPVLPADPTSIFLVRETPAPNAAAPIDVGRLVDNRLAGAITVGGVTGDLRIRNVATSAALPNLPTTLENLELWYTDASIALPAQATTITHDLILISGLDVADPSINDIRATESGDAATITVKVNGGATHTITDDANSQIDVGDHARVIASEGVVLADTATDEFTVGASALFASRSRSAVSVGTGGAVNGVNFGSVGVFGGAVTIDEDSATHLNGVDATSLDLATVTQLTQSGLDTGAGTEFVEVSGVTTITFPAAGGDVYLTRATADPTNAATVDAGLLMDNDLAGTFSVSPSPLGDLRLRNVSTTAAMPTLPAQLQDLELWFTNASIMLPNQAVDVLGDLSLVAGVDVSPATLAGTSDVRPSTGLALINVISDATASMTDQALTAVTVAGHAEFVAANNVTLADEATNVLDVTGDTTFASPGAGTIDVGSDAGASVLFGQLRFDGVDVDIVEDDATVLFGESSADTLVLTGGGSITDVSDADVAVANAASLLATGDITLGDEANNIDNFGSLNFVGQTVTISEDSDTELSGTNTADSLTLASAGAITDASDADLDVTGAAVFTATGDITLGDEANNIDDFGSLTFTGAAVSISEDSATELLGANSADSLMLTSAGAITDASDADVAVVGTASLSAGGDIVLGDEANNDTDFGSLNFVGQTVTFSEDSGTQLFGASTADSLTLTSAGAITDASDADLSVAGTTIFSATGDIVIGDEANNIDDFGTLTFTGAAVSIGEDSDTILLGTNTAVSLSLTSGGAITDASDADVDVTGAAAFTATGDITLGDEANNIDNFGTLTFTGAAVSISEDSDTELFGVSSAGSLELTSAAAITDASDADLSVTGSAVFTATGDITLGDEANNIDNFGTLTFTGAAVSISEDSDTELLGTNTAASLALSSSGAITDASDADLDVAGAAVFTATDDITLGDEANNIDNFDTLTFTGAAVSISEDSATELSGASTAASLALTSAGPITDAPDADIDVTGGASFNAVGDITLGDEANNDTDFGSLNFVGETVTITEDSGTNLFGVSAADSLMLTSGGAITDASDADLDVTSAAVFTATGDITLGDEVNNIDNFGTLNFTGAAVSISEDSDTMLVGTNTADSLVLSSGGEIADDPDADISIVGEASFIAVDDITLGDDANNDTNFGSLNFVGQTVTITEDSGTELFGASTADSLALTSAGMITDSSDADLNVVNAAVFTATSDITIGDEANNIDNFGTLTFTGAAVSISEDSDTMLVGTNTADSLVLASAGSIADAAGADLSVVGAASFDAAADITLGDEASNDTNFGSLNFDGVAVTIIEDSSTLLFDDNVASTLELTSTGAITDADNTTLTVATSASLLASGNDIVLGDGVGTTITFAFGSGDFAPVHFLSLVADNVSMQIDSSVNLLAGTGGTDVAGTLFLTSTGDVFQVNDGIGDLMADRAAIAANGYVVLTHTDFNQFAASSAGFVDITNASAMITMAVPDAPRLGNLDFAPLVPVDSSDTAASRFVRHMNPLRGNDYAVVLSNADAFTVTTIKDATNTLGAVHGIRSTAGNVFITNDAGDIVFEATGAPADVLLDPPATPDGTVVDVDNQYVFTAIASGELDVVNVIVDGGDGILGTLDDIYTLNTRLVTSTTNLMFVGLDGVAGTEDDGRLPGGDGVYGTVDDLLFDSGSNVFVTAGVDEVFGTPDDVVTAVAPGPVARFDVGVVSDLSLFQRTDRVPPGREYRPDTYPDGVNVVGPLLLVSPADADLMTDSTTAFVGGENDLTQTVELGFGRDDEQFFLVEIAWADTNRFVTAAQIGSTPDVPEVFGLRNTPDTVVPQIFTAERTVDFRHQFDLLFFSNNPHTPALRTEVRLFNDPGINLYDLTAKGVTVAGDVITSRSLNEYNETLTLVVAETLVTPPPVISVSIEDPIALIPPAQVIIVPEEPATFYETPGFSDSPPQEAVQIQTVYYSRVRDQFGNEIAGSRVEWKGEVEDDFQAKIREYVRESTEGFEDGFYQIWTETSDGVLKTEGGEFASPPELEDDRDLLLPDDVGTGEVLPDAPSTEDVKAGVQGRGNAAGDGEVGSPDEEAKAKSESKGDLTPGIDPDDARSDDELPDDASPLPTDGLQPSGDVRFDGAESTNPNSRTRDGLLVSSAILVAGHRKKPGKKSQRQKLDDLFANSSSDLLSTTNRRIRRASEDKNKE